jgi:curved DNA-binding protein CbpA
MLQACVVLGIESLSLLGIGGNDATKQLQNIRRKLARSNHPDKITDPALKIIATNKMAAINEAYDFLLKALEKRQREQEAEAAASQHGASSSAFFSSSSSSSSSSSFFSSSSSSSFSSSSSSSSTNHFPRAGAGFRRRTAGQSKRPSDVLRQMESQMNQRAAAPAPRKNEEEQRRRAAEEAQRRKAVQERRVQFMVEEAKRKKQKYRDERNKLMGQYHQIRSYLRRVQHPLIGETSTPVNMDASDLRELQSRLSQLPGCVQDNNVFAAKQDCGTMIRDSVDWVQKAIYALKVVDVLHRYKLCHHLRKLVEGTRSKRGVAAPVNFQREVDKQYELCEQALRNSSQSSSSTSTGATSSSRRRASSSKKKRKRSVVGGAVASQVKRQRAQQQRMGSVDEDEEMESSEEESEDESEKEEMELLSPTCVDRGWRVEFTAGETWFVAPHTTILMTGITSFSTVHDADLYEEKRSIRSQTTLQHCLKQLKENYVVIIGSRNQLTAEEKRANWMANALSHAHELKVNDTVDVMRRKWPGINKEGGRARVTSIHSPVVNKKKKKKKGTQENMSVEMRARAMAFRQMPRVNGGWSCSVCTFLNTDMTCDQCNVCETDRSEPPNDLLKECQDDIAMEMKEEKEEEEEVRKKYEEEAKIFPMQIDVSYILGGREKNLCAKYVRAARGEIGHHGSEEEDEEEDGGGEEVEVEDSAKESTRTSSRSGGGSNEQDLTSDELEELAHGMYDDLVQQSHQIRQSIEQEIHSKKNKRSEKTNDASSSSSTIALPAQETVNSHRRNEGARMLRLVADIDGVHRAYKKMISDEIKLSGGVSREKVNVPKRMQEMKMFCLQWIAKATTYNEADNKEVVEENKKNEMSGKEVGEERSELEEMPPHEEDVRDGDDDDDDELIIQ